MKTSMWVTTVWAALALATSYMDSRMGAASSGGERAPLV
jgi:hypothetical protein